MASVPAPLIDAAARRFRLLGDATRLRLLNALHEHGELSVGRLADEAGTTLANASKHLGQLERDGIVARSRHRTTVHYRIADPTLTELCDLVCTGLRERYAELAERVA
jgi:DNA-binding transcriptional ArsR family regulator